MPLIFFRKTKSVGVARLGVRKSGHKDIMGFVWLCLVFGWRIGRDGKPQVYAKICCMLQGKKLQCIHRNFHIIQNNKERKFR